MSIFVMDKDGQGAKTSHNQAIGQQRPSCPVSQQRRLGVGFVESDHLPKRVVFDWLPVRGNLGRPMQRRVNADSRAPSHDSVAAAPSSGGVDSYREHARQVGPSLTTGRQQARQSLTGTLAQSVECTATPRWIKPRHRCLKHALFGAGE